LRGYAKSDLFNSSVVFSAGMNPRLYNYLEKCQQFAADEFGEFVKKVTIKVSDYRSALIQGKYLAKKGIWPSEFRIESGLNCGGHAFASDGFLMGPILEEFKKKKDELITTLYEIYNNAIKSKGQEGFNEPHPVKITAQGGIGTAEEDLYLREFYQVESTGWGTPFLLVPEATTVDDNTLELLRKAEKKDIVLSNNSPLGVRFHYLRGTTSDLEKQEKIAKGKPGSPCTEKHLAFNTEFTDDPICTASRKYQKSWKKNVFA
jgi:NAD(P)H-dependent flavin oxidoreductase YrpB (nitropropane dioxygenase family)